MTMTIEEQARKAGIALQGQLRDYIRDVFDDTLDPDEVQDANLTDREMIRVFQAFDAGIRS